MDERQRRARSFGAIAGTYARVRPGYPPAAVAWLLPERLAKVVDLGAGTGALTKTLVARGIDVVAVEPDPEMRRVLRDEVPQAEVRQGRAEAIPVEDGSVDAVLAGQMWHWVEHQQALAEVIRVLRPGGRLGLLWNLRDERVAWMAALGRIIHGEDVYDALAGPVTLELPVDSPLGQVASRHFDWSQRLAPKSLVDLVASRSHVQVMAPETRAAVLAEVDEFVRTHPDLVGREEVTVPYVTRCVRAERRA